MLIGNCEIYYMNQLAVFTGKEKMDIYAELRFPHVLDFSFGVEISRNQIINANTVSYSNHKSFVNT